MKSKSPILEMKEVGKETFHNFEVTMDSEDRFDEICAQARLDIPKEELFNWWVNNALRQSINHIENQTSFQTFCMKMKIRLLRLTGRI